MVPRPRRPVARRRSASCFGTRRRSGSAPSPQDVSGGPEHGRHRELERPRSRLHRDRGCVGARPPACLRQARSPRLQPQGTARLRSAPRKDGVDRGRHRASRLRRHANSQLRDRHPVRADQAEDSAPPGTQRRHSSTLPNRLRLSASPPSRAPSRLGGTCGSPISAGRARRAGCCRRWLPTRTAA